MFSLNQLLKTKKKIYLSGDTIESQYFFENGISQLKSLLFQIKTSKYDINDFMLIIYKKTVIGLSFEFEEEIFLITPIISSIDSKFKFINILNKFNFRNKKLKCCPILNIHEFINSILSYFSLSFYNDFISLGSINNNNLTLIYSSLRIKKILSTLDNIKTVLKNRYNIQDDEILKTNALEICCGYGLSTIGLNLDNIYPLSIDNNKEDLSLGIHFNFLNLKKTVCLNCEVLSNYIQNSYFNICYGFMIGTIYSFNENKWKLIIYNSIKTIKNNGLLVFTTRTKEEIELLNIWLKKLTTKSIIFDNRDLKTEYDQWVYLGFKK